MTLAVRPLWHRQLDSLYPPANNESRKEDADYRDVALDYYNDICRRSSSPQVIFVWNPGLSDPELASAMSEISCKRIVGRGEEIRRVEREKIRDYGHAALVNFGVDSGYFSFWPAADGHGTNHSFFQDLKSERRLPDKVIANLTRENKVMIFGGLPIGGFHQVFWRVWWDKIFTKPFSLTCKGQGLNCSKAVAILLKNCLYHNLQEVREVPSPNGETGVSGWLSALSGAVSDVVVGLNQCRHGAMGELWRDAVRDSLAPMTPNYIAGLFSSNGGKYRIEVSGTDIRAINQELPHK